MALIQDFDLDDDFDELPEEEGLELAGAWDAEEEPPAEEEEEEEPDASPEPEPEPEPTPKPKPEQPVQVAAEVDQQTPAFRSPICVIMGHVDTGKTKLLDKIRRTNVQTGEAGGITQQIGATYFPVTAIQKMVTGAMAETFDLTYNIPGLLIIDTPGHESFSNLRSRGSSLCDIAILVVDIMHGIEPQTLESIGMLQKRKTPFIIALNKIDRLSDWKAPKKDYTSFINSIRSQSNHAKEQFKKRASQVMMEFQQEGINTKLYTQMKFDAKSRIAEVPIVPTSAHTGEGIPDLLMLMETLAETKMTRRLASKQELQCTVLEVKVEEGIGTTLDVILVNGVLRVNDTIVLAGLDGPIVTKIRALLTPDPMKELRVRSQWRHHDVIYAAMGCKISAPGLEGAIAGSELFVAKSPNDVDDLMDKVTADVDSVFDMVDKANNGVMVKASTLGSLEALLSYLQSQNIPVAHANIGPVTRSDVTTIAPMVDKDDRYAVILAFDVLVHPEAAMAANKHRITIFQAEIIYHLTDQYEIYLEELKQRKKDELRNRTIFPCELEFLPNTIFNRTKPIVIGIRVVEGTLTKGMPIVVLTPKPLYIGTIESIKDDDNDLMIAKRGTECSVSIKAPGNSSIIAGKDFKAGDEMFSKITRDSIENLKSQFRDEVSGDEWRLIIRMKSKLHIQ